MKIIFNCTQALADTLEISRAANNIVLRLDISGYHDMSVQLSINDAKKLRKSLKKLIREAEDNYVSVR